MLVFFERVDGKVWQPLIPGDSKKMSLKQLAQSKKARDIIFGLPEFQERFIDMGPEALRRYNNRPSPYPNLSRREAGFYVTFIEDSMGAMVYCKQGGKVKAAIGLAQQTQNLEDTKAIVGPLITSLKTHLVRIETF